MRTNKFIFLILLLSSCATTNLKSSRSYFPEELIKIQPGLASKSDVLEKMGKPHEVSRSGPSTTWTYYDKNYKYLPRAQIEFKGSSVLVYSHSINTFSSDKLSSLTTVKKYLLPTKLSKLPAPDHNPHSMPEQIYFDNNKEGIRVIYYKSPERVVSIIRAQPGTNMRSFDNSPPDPNIEFTIGKPPVKKTTTKNKISNR